MPSKTACRSRTHRYVEIVAQLFELIVNALVMISWRVFMAVALLAAIILVVEWVG
jgi:hypothetical protein